MRINPCVWFANYLEEITVMNLRRFLNAQWFLNAQCRSVDFSFRPVALSLILLGSSLLILSTGCGSAEEMHTVQGKVSFGAEAVTEGTVTLEESATKTTVQATLAADGKYSMRVPPGKYKVTVEPPMVPETRGSDAGMTYKNVKNIPNNVRQSGTSQLSADVSGDATFDFELKK